VGFARAAPLAPGAGRTRTPCMTDPSRSRDERADKMTGIPWVYVGRAAAHAHPKGQLGPLEWAIAVFMILVGLGKIWALLADGSGVPMALGVAIWPVLAGVGLIIRIPWALVLTVISAGLTLLQLFRGLKGGIVGDMVAWIYLAEMLIFTGILFYLMDGERPNLIYRHRYRKYSVLRDGDDA